MKGPEKEARRWFLQAEDDLLQIYTGDDLAEAYKDLKKVFEVTRKFLQKKGIV